jgi:hypothetical protein
LLRAAVLLRPVCRHYQCRLAGAGAQGRCWLAGLLQVLGAATALAVPGGYGALAS